MPSLKGEYEHSVDNKGRVSFPAKLRKALTPRSQDRFTILRGLENCLYLYPEDRWEKVEEHLSNISDFTREGRMVKRLFLRTAEDLTLDKQNRLALPSKLMEYAGIDGKAVIVGTGDRIEIWSPEEYAIELGKISDEKYQESFERVMTNGES